MSLYLISLWIMGLLYIAAGVNHFIKPKFYINIMPKWFPAHKAMVALSGVAEIALGIGLLIPQTRALSAWGIIAMLIVFFIVHFDMVYDFYKTKNKLLWFAILRLPIQVLLIWWAWVYTG